MTDQLIIDGKASFDEYGASLMKRKINMPAKKSIKETVPFSNVTYDFSAINGEVYWKERTLEYVFEIIADNPEKLEELKLKFTGWVMNIQEARLQDPFIPDYYFKATYDDIDFDDDEGLEKTTVTVKFTAYPYMISNHPKIYEKVIPASGRDNLTILNESAHPVALTITNDQAVMIEMGNNSYAISAGARTDEKMRIPTGLTSMVLKNNGTELCTVRASFYEEVF